MNANEDAAAAVQAVRPAGTGCLAVGWLAGAAGSAPVLPGEGEPPGALLGLVVLPAAAAVAAYVAKSRAMRRLVQAGAT